MELVSQKIEKANILLVDDNERNLEALALILQDSEYNLVQANSGLEALNHIRRIDFAVVLLDILMPEMDGFETAATIRQNQQSRDLPIVFVTAVADDLYFVHRGYQVGAADYIQKPIDPSVIKAKVAFYVRMWRSKHQLQLDLENSRSVTRELRKEVAEGRENQERMAEDAQQLAESFQELVNPIVASKPSIKVLDK